jgi:hypothetical protein
MTGMERESRLLDLCERIAKGEPIDWTTPEFSDQALLPETRALQEVERVVRGFRESSPSPPPSQPIGTWGPLHLLERLADGSFGEVYRAFDPRLDRQVALKLFRVSGSENDPVALDRCLREARQLARVRHRNVMAIYGADFHDARAGIWTEFIRGKTLESHLASDGTFNSDEASRVGIELCRALAEVHAVGLIHQDVKASNVMREEGGRIVLMDFGAASVRSALKGEAGVYGTLITAAPEVLQGQTPSAASDVYALGVLLYRLVTLRYPMEASTLGELLEKHDRGARVHIREIRPEISESFAAAVETALDPRAERRFGSALEFERALINTRLAAHDGQRSREEEGGGGSRAFRRAAAAVIAIAVFVAGWLVVTRLWGNGRPAGRPEPLATAPPASPTLAPVSANLLLDRNATVTALEDGDRIRPGDGIFLDFRANMPLWTYVVNRDKTGALFVLFPLPGFDLQNPLPPGVSLRLPGKRKGVLESWKVSSPGGEEEFILIATGSRRENLEKALATLPHAVPQIDTSEIKELRGVGRTSPSVAPGSPEGSRRLPEALRAILDASAPSDPDVWVRRFRLRNPESP